MAAEATGAEGGGNGDGAAAVLRAGAVGGGGGGVPRLNLQAGEVAAPAQADAERENSDAEREKSLLEKRGSIEYNLAKASILKRLLISNTLATH